MQIIVVSESCAFSDLMLSHRSLVKKSAQQARKFVLECAMMSRNLATVKKF